MPRRMVIVAGPPGAGKSSLFPLTDFADNVFNADDRAAALNDRTRAFLWRFSGP